MKRGRATTSAKISVPLLAASLLQWPPPVGAAPVATEKTACDLTKARVAARGHFPVSVIAFCDIIGAEDSPRGYYVLALHSTRKCDGICSTNMGWFAIQKSTGRVFEFDLEEWKPGPLVHLQP